MSETVYDKLKGPGPDLSRYRETRLPDESEKRFLVGLFESARSEGSCFVYAIWSIIVILGGGGALYAAFKEGILAAVVIGVVTLLGALFSTQILLPMARRQINTTFEEGKSLLHIEGLFRLDLRATGVGTKVYLDDVPVSVPMHWPKIYPAYVEAEIYPTNSGQHLVVSMRYQEPQKAEQAAQEYAMKSRGRPNCHRFTIAEEVENGRLKPGKKIYVFNA